MAFTKSALKLRQARILAEGLDRTRDLLTAQALFNAYLTAAKSITNAIQKEGKDKPGFATWWKVKRDEMRADELLRYIHTKREEGYHQAVDPLDGAVYIVVGEPHPRDTPAPPILPHEFTREGAFWIHDAGTPDERRVPMSPNNWSITLLIRDAPSSHRGSEFRADLSTICSLSLTYYEELVAEAASEAWR